MKFIKWALIFISIFCLSLVLIKTLSLETFNLTASAWFFGVSIPEMPVYYYVLGAFIIGLSIGIITAVYYFVSFKTEGLKKTKRINHLEKEAETLNIKIASQKENLNKLEQELVQEKSKALYKPEVQAPQRPQPQQPIQSQPIQQMPIAQNPNLKTSNPVAPSQPQQPAQNSSTPKTNGDTNSEFSLEDFLDN